MTAEEQKKLDWQLQLEASAQRTTDLLHGHIELLKQLGNDVERLKKAGYSISIKWGPMSLGDGIDSQLDYDLRPGVGS